MKKEKLIKKQIIKEASANPQKYFPVDMLKQEGFTRQKCQKCSTMFWSVENRKVCGDTNCVGEYSFIGDSPAQKKFSFPELYKVWEKYMKSRDYLPVKRFPIVARWRDDLDFNIASIIGFQPYVTKGEIEPPAQLVTIPQNCLRFADIDNIGYTGRHFTGFTMIGQLAFKQPNEYDQAKYVKDLLEWFTTQMKIPKEELQIHEDAWVGGGDCGPSMEFFSRGLELANQVYMWYDMSDANDIKDLKELSIKVLDMGMGQERCVMFSHGVANSYDVVMPNVCKYLFEKAQFKPNWDLYNTFMPYSGLLNLDEVEDIDKAWEEVASKMNSKHSVQELKEQIDPIASIYAIADHTRSLLYALTDGALPSNVKGGYNLRLLLRRSLDFIHNNNWDINLYDVIVLHAQELKEMYPDLQNELGGIKSILDIEVEKYHAHKEKVHQRVEHLAKQNTKLNEEEYIKLYISEGITPHDLQLGFKSLGNKLQIPANFYTLVTEYFEAQKELKKKDDKHELKDLVEGIEKTEQLYYENSYNEEFESKIVKEFTHKNNTYIILDRTLFYPTGGGQQHDLGELNGKKVINVISIEGVILHQVEN